MRSVRPLALAFALLAACVSAPQAPVEAARQAWAEEPDTDDLVKLTIVGTNDLHGWLEPHDRTGAGGGAPVLGGIDAFAAYLGIVRAKRPDGVVLLDAGDLFQGTLVANMTEGEVVIKAYNMLDYDGVAVGNHEFDYGPEGDNVLALTPAEDPLGNLKKRMEQARFPFLAANITARDTGKPPPWPARRSMLIDRKGVHIGVIGMSTPMTPSVTLAQNVAGLAFADLAETALGLSKELRAQGAQVVVVTMHAGGGCTLGDPHALENCNTKEELFQMLAKLPPGTVDAVVAGHTHQYLAHFVGGVPVIQSSSFGVAFGMVELWYDRKQNRVDTSRTKIWQPIPLCRKVFASTGDCRKEADGALEPPEFMGESVEPVAAVFDALRPEFRLVAVRKNEELGPRLDFGYTRSRTRESELGDLVTDIMRDAIPGTRVAVTNSGGLRTDLDPGAVTYGKVFNALPFENRLAVLQLTGEELVAFLAQGVAGEHGVLQVSGVRVEAVDPGSEPCPGSARLLSATLEDGAPIDPAATYQLVTNDFVAGGGDGFDKVINRVDPDRIKIRVDMPPLREVVVAHMRVHPELSGPVHTDKARLKFIKPTCAAATAPARP